MLRAGRRHDVPRDRRRSLYATAAVVLLHVFFLLALWHEMRPPPPRVEVQVVHASLDDALQVRFVPRDHAAASALPPPVTAPPSAPSRVARATPESRPAPKRASRPSPEPVRDDAMVAHMDTPAAAGSVAPPKLYSRDGAALLPPSGQPPKAGAPGYVQRKPTGDMQVMEHSSPLPYKATRFDKYFPPPDENIAQAGLRHVVQAIAGKGGGSKTVNLPHGVHLKCKTLLGVPTPMCGMPPAPPPPNDGDERLSMAPTPLAKDPHAKPPPSLATCIAAYRSQGPLPYGCPVDTPARAVDAEISECIALFRAGKRLKTWCPADTARRAAAAEKAGGPAPAASTGG